MINSIINFLQTSTDTIFWASAVLGTVFFLLRILMSLLGGGFFEDDIDLDGLQEGHEHHSGALFKFLTMHSLSGFLMMFGWSGLACAVQFKMVGGYSFLIALACGITMLIITALIMRTALLFEAPGARFSTKKTLGVTGMVYQRIPAEGQGKIHITVNGVTRELLAQSYHKKIIESFTLIKVVNVIDHEIVEVIELTEESL
jgi:hypothetical protein